MGYEIPSLAQIRDFTHGQPNPGFLASERSHMELHTVWPADSGECLKIQLIFLQKNKKLKI